MLEVPPSTVTSEYWVRIKDETKTAIQAHGKRGDGDLRLNYQLNKIGKAMLTREESKLCRDLWRFLSSPEKILEVYVQIWVHLSSSIQFYMMYYFFKIRIIIIEIIYFFIF